MKKIIIDYNKWRCGGTGNCMVGKGRTMMLNEEGYMCCLGQAALQLNPELKPENIINTSTPCDIPEEIEYLKERRHHDSSLSSKAMKINDSKAIDNSTRIKELTELFKEHNLELEFINVPDNIDELENSSAE